MRRLHIRLLIAAALLLGSCEGSIDINIDVDDGEEVEGSGAITTEDRAVGDFDRIELAGEGRVIIEHGPAALTIETDDNLLTHIESTVSGGTLRISTESGIDIDPSDGVKYRVATERLGEITLSGAGDIDTADWSADEFTITLAGAGDIAVTGVRAGRLNVTISGVGQVTVAGSADRLTMSLPGAGNFEGGDLAAVDVAVTASGAGSATVWAARTLDATVSGVGSIDYFGSPQVTQSVTGIGSINSRGDK